MKRVLTCTLAFLLLGADLGAAPVQNGSRPKETSKKVAQQPYQIGTASWYGKSFHGRTTASGETYDMFEFTAAHRQLPLGTWVKVTNLRNGKWIIVRVNDRGPFEYSRIIDLSYGAAQMLGFRGRGTENVRLDLVEAESVAQANSSAPEPGNQQ